MSKGRQTHEFIFMQCCFIVRNKLASAHPVIDNELHKIVKVVCESTQLAIALWIHSFFNNVMTKSMVNDRTAA